MSPRSTRRTGSSVVATLRSVVLPFLVSRALVLLALEAARLYAHHRPHDVRAVGTSGAGLLSWDASWYQRIAEVGYGGAGRSSLRFFPLFPLLGHLGGALPGISDGAALVVLANLAALLAFALLRGLVLHETGNARAADRSVWVLALSPAAFVLVMGYAEALLLCLSIGAFWCWRREEFAWSIVPAALAGLCRPVGVLLALPALIEAARGLRGSRSARDDLRAREWLVRGAAVLAAPAGACAYLGWAGSRYGSFWLPLREQVSRRHRGGIADPIVTLWHDARDLAGAHHLGTSFHLPWAIAFVLLAAYVFARLPASYGWYAVATLAVALTAPNLDSLERYGLACFPLAVAGALLLERRALRLGVFAVMGCALVGYGALAFVGSYVP